jgi:hypothetical protein
VSQVHACLIWSVRFIRYSSAYAPTG